MVDSIYCHWDTSRTEIQNNPDQHAQFDTAEQQQLNEGRLDREQKVYMSKEDLCIHEELSRRETKIPVLSPGGGSHGTELFERMSFIR